MSLRLQSRTLLFVILVAGLICMAGCKPEQSNAGHGETTGSSNPQLQSEMDRDLGLTLEFDPDKRPLILSEPASSRRQWVIQALQTGYLNTGKTNPAWDKKVETAFKAFADYTRVNATNWTVLKTALADLTATECSDPMIRYLYVRYHNEIQPEVTTAQQFIQAHDGMLLSAYHPLFKFFAGMRAVEAARVADKNGNRGRRIERITVDLQDLARDTNAPIEEVYEPAFMWLGHSRSKEWNQYIFVKLNPILEKNWGQTEYWFRFRADEEVWMAWGERGKGWASTVSDKGWEGFAEHLDKAEQFLTKAWQMNPSNTYTAYLMMQVELGQGKGRARMETWFNRAMALEPSYYDAVKIMSFYIEPRWYGSEQEALEFGRSCVASDKWGGQVPLVLANVHHSLANYSRMSNSPAYWHQPQVWRDVKSSYEKFFVLCPDAAGWRHNYAKDAYDCGEYAVFLQQTKLFAYGTNFNFFGGKDKFQKMLETASAQTQGK